MAAIPISLSPAALQLILEHEVGGGKAYYNERLARPTWPGGSSGVTIGIGYDLGYTPTTRFLGDWHGLEDDVRHALISAIGLRGLRAKDKAIVLRRTITIPWDVAWVVFQARTIPFWIGQTVKAFPRSVDLPADAFGALVSLVFNRGPALHGKNRQDMDDISGVLADGVQCGDLKLIARQLREMKVIWAGRGLPGLIRRREDEAKLVEAAGCSC